MTAVYIIAIFILALTSFALFRSKRSTSTRENHQSLTPTRYGGLFGAGAEPDASTGRPRLSASPETLAARADEWRARAARGEREVLLEAHESGDAALYDELLDALAARAASSEEALRSLASFIRENERLRANAALVEALLARLNRSPDAGALLTTEVLHVAALSGDASMYGRAIDAALSLWREGRISMSAVDLRALIESHYWMLAPEARSSGAGFVLKQTLADARRFLMAARRAPTPTETLKQASASEEENHEHDS